MKFFSNEAKENDEPGYDRTDVATSEPVAVPQQRAGSPWSDSPASDYRDPSDDRDSAHRDGSDRADNSDDELSEQELRDGTEERPSTEPVSTTYGPDGTVTTSDSVDSADSVDSDTQVGSEHDRDSVEDEALKDEGTFDSPEVVDPNTGEAISDADRDRSDDDRDRPDYDGGDRDRPDYDGGDRDRFETEATLLDETPAAEADRRDDLNGAPVAVDTEPVPALASEESTAVAGSGTDNYDHGEAVADVAAVPVETPSGATPGSVPAPALDRLFSDGDSFAERFRDIQLRFVDSPKEATADAATLVGEAVEKITSALNSQKDALGGDSDDTEQLRVQLRGYRDLLNRLTGL
jgi:hypothetical protein